MGDLILLSDSDGTCYFSMIVDGGCLSFCSRGYHSLDGNTLCMNQSIVVWCIFGGE